MRPSPTPSPNQTLPGQRHRWPERYVTGRRSSKDPPTTAYHGRATTGARSSDHGIAPTANRHRTPADPHPPPWRCVGRSTAPHRPPRRWRSHATVAPGGRATPPSKNACKPALRSQTRGRIGPCHKITYSNRTFSCTIRL
jgi:hypothetical protein